MNKEKVKGVRTQFTGGLVGGRSLVVVEYKSNTLLEMSKPTIKDIIKHIFHIDL